MRAAVRKAIARTFSRPFGDEVAIINGLLKDINKLEADLRTKNAKLARKDARTMQVERDRDQERAAKVAIHDDWSDAVLANMRLRASHVAICEALDAALARVSYVPGDHPVVPAKHARFVEDVAAVLSAALMPPSPMPNDAAARNAATE